MHVSRDVVILSGILKLPNKPKISITASSIGRLASIPPSNDLNTNAIILNKIIEAIPKLMI